MDDDLTVYTDSSELSDAEEEIQGFLAQHKGDLTDEERDELGELLDQRAAAISDVLGVEVKSVTSIGEDE